MRGRVQLFASDGQKKPQDLTTRSDEGCFTCVLLGHLCPSAEDRVPHLNPEPVGILSQITIPSEELRSAEVTMVAPWNVWILWGGVRFSRWIRSYSCENVTWKKIIKDLRKVWVRDGQTKESPMSCSTQSGQVLRLMS